MATSLAMSFVDCKQGQMLCCAHMPMLLLVVLLLAPMLIIFIIIVMICVLGVIVAAVYDAVVASDVAAGVVVSFRIAVTDKVTCFNGLVHIIASAARLQLLCWERVGVLRLGSH